MDFKYKVLSSDEEKSSSDDDDYSFQKLLPTIRIPSRFLAVSTVILPFGAFVFSVFYALHSNYKSATLVFCHEGHVFNYLPSLSAAIGDFSFSKSIWILCVTMHTPPRFLYAYLYYKYLKSVIYKRHRFWVKLAFFVNIVEILSLLGLSYVSSKASLPLHALNFCMFMISSLLYMIIMCVLLHQCRNIPCCGSVEVKSQRVKLRFLMIIGMCGFALPYFYVRHNTYCEPGIYTFFALTEYIVVVCNMGFHMTAYWDFYDVVFTIPVRKCFRHTSYL